MSAARSAIGAWIRQVVIGQPWAMARLVSVALAAWIRSSMSRLVGHAVSRLPALCKIDGANPGASRCVVAHLRYR